MATNPFWQPFGYRDHDGYALVPAENGKVKTGRPTAGHASGRSQAAAGYLPGSRPRSW